VNGAILCTTATAVSGMTAAVGDLQIPTLDRVLALEPLQRHGRGLVKASVGHIAMADGADPSLDVD